MVKAIKLYVGNLPDNTKSSELQAAFEKYGKVEECDVLRNYAFIHISNEDEAKVAKESLNNSEFNGSRITVEISHNKGQCFRCGRQGHIPKECPLNTKTYSRNNSSPKATKLYVGNLHESVTSADLRTLFEKYGEVDECDVLKNYGFVHMGIEDDAKDAVESLHQSEFMGTKINVEISKSKGQCYSCGQHGHWSKECMSNMGGRSGPGSSSIMSRFGRQFDRGFGMERSYRTERMRPYPDMYDRRPFALPRASSDDYYRGYSDYYGYSRSTPSYMNSDRDYDYGQYRRSQGPNSSSSYNYMWSSSNPNSA